MSKPTKLRSNAFYSIEVTEIGIIAFPNNLQILKAAILSEVIQDE